MRNDGREDWELTPDELELKKTAIRKRQNLLDENLNCEDLPKPESKLEYLFSSLGLVGVLIVATLLISTTFGVIVGGSLGYGDYARMKGVFWEKINGAEQEAHRYKNELENISREFQQYKENIEKARDAKVEY